MNRTKKVNLHGNSLGSDGFNLVLSRILIVKNKVNLFHTDYLVLFPTEKKWREVTLNDVPGLVLLIALLKSSYKEGYVACSPNIRSDVTVDGNFRCWIF
jgi:general stress protein CsbA